MPFIAKYELDSLQAQNDDLRARLAGWETMAPFLELGKELQAELVTRLGSTAICDIAGMSVQEIGEAAYEAVKQKELDDARDKLTAEYEQTHRKALYAKLLGEVDATEGEDISKGVFEQLDSNPKLAKELRDSARTELTARARDVVLAHVTEEQQVVIEAETDRQIALDKLDVRFALDGKLNLQDEALLELLRPNDKLVILFPKHESGQAGLRFGWEEDIDGVHGWVYKEPILPKSNTSYTGVDPQVGRIPQDRFVQLGSEMLNLTKGTVGVRQDILIAGKPLNVSWVGSNNNAQNFTVKEEVRAGNYSRTLPSALVVATDFQTRDIEFINSAI